MEIHKRLAVTLGMSPRRTLVTGGSGFIGTNLVEALLESGREVLNLDLSPPRNPVQSGCHRRIDLLDRSALAKAIEAFQPQEVIHLAARTDYAGKDAHAYAVNTEGTRNLLTALVENAEVQRCLFTSSMMARAVTGPARAPGDLYADSKARAEALVMQASALASPWCIVRPVSIWGPWFAEPFRDYFLAIARGRYRHPGAINPRKQMGYVGNVVFQMLALLDAEPQRIHRRTFYLADDEIVTLQEWTLMIAAALGKPAPGALPDAAIRLAAGLGDLLQLLGWASPPMHSARLRNMRMDSVDYPVAAMREIAPALPYTVAAGVAETVAWLRREALIA